MFGTYSPNLPTDATLGSGGGGYTWNHTATQAQLAEPLKAQSPNQLHCLGKSNVICVTYILPIIRNSSPNKGLWRHQRPSRPQMVIFWVKMFIPSLTLKRIFLRRWGPASLFSLKSHHGASVLLFLPQESPGIPAGWVSGAIFTDLHAHAHTHILTRCAV